MKRIVWGVGFALCVLWAAGPGRAAEKPLRFAFEKGQTLTYRVALTGEGAGSEGVYSGTWEGTVVLKVAQVQADGTALIRVNTTGKGRMQIGSEAMDLDQEPIADVIAVMKPDGAVTALRDSAGKPTSLLQQDGLNILSAPVAIRAYALGSYALFGLLLGNGSQEKWTASLKHETGMSKTVPKDWSEMTVTLSSAPVDYSRGEPTECNGHPCVDIAATSVVYPEKDNTATIFPGTFCLDTANGRLLSMKAKAKVPTGEGVINYTAELVPSPRSGESGEWIAES